MKKSYVLIGLFLIFIIVITVVGTFIVSGNQLLDKEADILVVQKNKEAYFNLYGYTVDNPNIIVNPYGNSPLTAIVLFETKAYSNVKITIKGKNNGSDINYKFEKDKYHIIPIYGLYADYENTVIIESENIKKTIKIKTDKLPDDFILSNDKVDGYSFYNNNYPYAIDSEGNVRWYLNEHYYGNITLLDNSSIVVGSDRYDENGNTISLYKMNLLGKIYNEYMLKESYYGYNTLYNNDILVLSDKIMLIDIQTGEVIGEYIDNDNYDYLDISNGDIVVRNNDTFYKIKDDTLEEIEYSIFNKKYSFYNNTVNYKIVTSSRFGSLNETTTSDSKINLIKYEEFDSFDDISVISEVDRLKVINNTDKEIYLILDKFFDKRIYKVNDIKYVNYAGLNGKYTIYFKIENVVYKTNYYVEV